jgi:hypothetical protein
MTETTPALPVETGGYGNTRFNALRHGVLSRYAVLPWEDPEEYATLLGALAAEHAPRGPTEEHLVEELAGILWRKRRLRLAEAAAHRQGLETALSPYRSTAKAALAHLGGTEQAGCVKEAIRATDADTERETADVDEDEAMTRRALKLLGTRRNDAYEAALAALRADTRAWWADRLAGDPDDEGDPDEEEEDDAEPYAANPQGLRRFLEGEMLPWLAARRQELAHRPLLRAQAFGEAMEPERLERLGRYEVHLDRKLERTLALLLKLQELRRATSEG